MGLTFSKIIFGILFIGIIFTGFINFGNEITNNSNLNNETQAYLNNLNSSVQSIENLQVQQTNVSIGEEDSFSKQYKEAKLYAETASGMLSTAGDTPALFINALDVEQESNQWLINYIYLAISLAIFLIVLYMLFGRTF